MDFAQRIRQAARQIAPFVRTTPLEHSLSLSQAHGMDVFCKLECVQKTGSFKVRGAVHKLTTLTDAQRAIGVVTASSGNHGAGVAYGGSQLDVPVQVLVPQGADPGKIAAIRAHGATVAHFGTDCVETEAEARRRADAEGLVYISPYNDLDVMAGQGTIGLEMHQQLEGLDAVLVSVGGGGLIGGIGSFLKSVRPEVEVIACSPERSPAMHACLQAGRVIDVPCFPTLSDATAGGVEPGSVTFERCQAVVDRSVLVSEEEIRQAVVDFISHHHLLVEGAAGVALAGLAHLGPEFAGKRVAVVICGANIGLEKLRSVLGESGDA